MLLGDARDASWGKVERGPDGCLNALIRHASMRYCVMLQTVEYDEYFEQETQSNPFYSLILRGQLAALRRICRTRQIEFVASYKLRATRNYNSQDLVEYLPTELNSTRYTIRVFTSRSMVSFRGGYGVELLGKPDRKSVV